MIPTLAKQNVLSMKENMDETFWSRDRNHVRMLTKAENLSRLIGRGQMLAYPAVTLTIACYWMSSGLNRCLARTWLSTLSIDPYESFNAHRSRCRNPKPRSVARSRALPSGTAVRECHPRA
jgi:hypothetical protein